MTDYQPPTPEYMPPGEPPRTNGLALAAMICGLVGLVFAPIGLVGLILGIVALSKRRGPMDPGKGQALTGVIAGSLSMVLCVCLIPAILLPSLNRAREAANRIKCSSNMRQIGLAVKMYSNAERGSLFPADLTTLARGGELQPDVFIDPTSTNKPADANNPNWSADIYNGSTHCDYIYVWKPGYSDALDSNTVILYEPLTNHRGDGANFLFADDHVEWYSAADAQRMIDQINAGVNPPH